MEVPARYQWAAMTTNETFPDNGFGPFVVQQKEIRDKIIMGANPNASHHISGCRGAGKTTLLHLIADDLTAAGKKVFFFETASLLNHEVYDLVKRLEISKEEVFFLIDETQDNVQAAAFTPLLKNSRGHKITTIGAGVPEFDSISSGHFKRKIVTEELFLSSDDMLEEKGVVLYFSQNASTQAQAAEIRKMIQKLRVHVGGCIYPLMWLSEKFTPKIINGEMTAEAVMEHILDSHQFRKSQDFQDMIDRILPSPVTTNVESLLYKNRDTASIYNLKRTGFCNSSGKIISQLLFDSFIQESLTGEQSPVLQLLEIGVAGVQQLLVYGLPKMEWTQYMPHGGPMEDALTFELFKILARVRHLGPHLFNPKLINAGTVGSRKPDLYLNNTIHSYVECVLTTANNNDSERKNLDEHISRFYWQKYEHPAIHSPPAYYQIGSSANFAILNYQETGTQPLQPYMQFFQGQIFAEKVFTFLMSTKEVYKGNELIYPTKAQ